MKHLFSVLLLFSTLFLFGQKNQSEEILFSFKTKNGKSVSIIKEKSNAYLYYQFSNNNKVELQYPSIKSIDSWSKFQYNTYSRGGGKANSGMEIANLKFINDGFEYLLYQTYFAETEKYKIGIIITDLKSKKETKINGIYKTVQGNLFGFEDNTPLKIEDIGLDF